MGLLVDIRVRRKTKTTRCTEQLGKHEKYVQYSDVGECTVKVSLLGKENCSK